MDPVRAQSFLQYPNEPRRSRARRVLGVLGVVVGVTVTFVAGVAAAALVHLDAPATRRLVATEVTGILHGVLAGDVRLEHLDHLGLDGVRGVRVTIADPDGVQVLAASGVDVRVEGLAAARSALLGKGPITVRVPSVRVGQADANLDGDETGNLRLARTFAPKNPSPPDPNEAPGRGVIVEAPAVALGHAWVHGTPPGAILVDADVREVAASAHVDPAVIRAELARLDLVARAVPQGADPRGTIHGTFAMPAATGKGMAVKALFDGDVGGAETHADAQMDDEAILARIDTKDATGARVSALSGDAVAVREAFSLHAEAHGTLPRIEAKAALAVGRATVDTDAVVELGEAVRVVANVHARHVDAAAVSAGAPRTDVGLDARGDVTIKGDELFGEAAVDTLPGTAAGQRVPRTEVRAKLAGKNIQLRANVRDGELPATVAVDVSPRTDGRAGQLVAATVQAAAPSLGALPIVGAQVKGSATVDARARVLLPEKAIVADATVTARSLRAGGAFVGAAKVTASAAGTADAPVIDAAVHAKNLVTGNLPLAFVDARAKVAVAGGEITIDEPRVATQRTADGTNTYGSVQARARKVVVGGEALVVQAAEIGGLGEPVKADVEKHGQTVRAKVSAPRIDLPLVVRLAGLGRDVPLARGSLALDVDGELRGKNAKGIVRATVRELDIANVKDGTLDLDASLEERKVALDLRARAGRVGRIVLRTDSVELGGPAAEPASWQKAQGKVNLVSEVDLGRVASALPQDTLPLADLRGILAIEGRLGRDTGTAPPEVQLHAHTLGLVAAGKSQSLPPMATGVRVEDTPPWRTSGLDLALDVRNDARSGLTSVAARATDAKGIVVAVDTKTVLPYEAILAAPAKAKGLALAAPLSGRLVVPARRLEDMPAIAGLKDVQGAVEANLEIGGTALEPTLHLDARGRDIQAPGMAMDAKANCDVAMDYDGKLAELAIKMREKGKDLLDVTTRVEARARDFLAPADPTKPADWNAAGRVRLAGFPLATLPVLSQRRIRGTLNGDVSLEGLHRDALLKGKISFDDLRIGRARYTKGEVTVDTSNQKLAAHVRMEQSDGYLDAGVETGMAWGARVAPELDKGQPIVAKLDAKGFRAAAIQPFVESQVTSLDGRIDANATAKVVPGVPGAALEGKVLFHEGTVEVAALGDELRDVTVSAVMKPDGTITVDKIEAHGAEGVVTGDAHVKLDGVRLADATATIRIPERKAFAVNANGMPLGEVSGTLVAKASQSEDGKQTKVGVEIPKLKVDLPASTKTGVQSLEKKEDVRVGVYRGPHNFVKVPLDYDDTLPPKKKEEEEATSTELGVKIGNIEIVRGNSARVNVTGGVTVKMADRTTKIEGKISSNGGWADVQGRKFTIEKADVIFNGQDPPNPTINAQAKMVAQDGTQVFADFVGPVSTGKVTLHSDPPRTQSEILGLIVFGTPDGANPAPQKASNQAGSTTKTAVGLGGGYAAQGLTEGLDDLAGVHATARIDSTDNNNPKPEVEFQISQKVAIAFAYVIGTPPPTEPDTAFFSVDYRFKRNWSLESTVGNVGRFIFDAIWQKSY